MNLQRHFAHPLQLANNVIVELLVLFVVRGIVESLAAKLLLDLVQH